MQETSAVNELNILCEQKRFNDVQRNSRIKTNFLLSHVRTVIPIQASQSRPCWVHHVIMLRDVNKARDVKAKTSKPRPRTRHYLYLSLIHISEPTRPY